MSGRRKRLFNWLYLTEWLNTKAKTGAVFNRPVK
jgi:hypothetical protein